MGPRRRCTVRGPASCRGRGRRSHGPAAAQPAALPADAAAAVEVSSSGGSRPMESNVKANDTVFKFINNWL